jgi:flagellar biosynthesis chaperone FliJ
MVLLDEQITTAQLTLQQLSLKRQLKQVRDQRREANEQHRQLAQNSEDRMARAAKRGQVMIHGMRNLSDYFTVVKALYPSNPGHYVLRNHAQLLMCIRSQHILENYNRLTEHQYGTFIEVLEETVQDLRMDVQELHNEREEKAYLLHEQTVILATSRIKCYYQEKNNDARDGKNVHQTSLIQQLVKRKANERLLTTCI